MGQLESALEGLGSTPIFLKVTFPGNKFFTMFSIVKVRHVQYFSLPFLLSAEPLLIVTCASLQNFSMHMPAQIFLIWRSGLIINVVFCILLFNLADQGSRCTCRQTTLNRSMAIQSCFIGMYHFLFIIIYLQKLQWFPAFLAFHYSIVTSYIYLNISDDIYSLQYSRDFEHMCQFMCRVHACM